MPPKFLEDLVILCFERWYPNQNIVARLKSNILPQKNFGLATQLFWSCYSLQWWGNLDPRNQNWWPMYFSENGPRTLSRARPNCL